MHSFNGTRTHMMKQTTMLGFLSLATFTTRVRVCPTVTTIRGRA